MRVTFVLIFALMLNFGNGYKILGISHTNIRSHYNVGSALLKGLAEKGHEITILTPIPPKKPVKNWRIIKTTEFKPAESEVPNFAEFNKMSIFDFLKSCHVMGLAITNTTFEDQATKKFLQSNEKFDLVIMEAFMNEAMLGFGHHFKAPVIAFSTFGASIWTNDMVGTPSPLSFVPNAFIGYGDRMNIWERITNIIVVAYEKVFTTYVYMPKQEAIYEKAFPDPKPTLAELHRNVSLVLLNNHFTLSFPRPYVPNMIEVGGMHIKTKSDPLPKDMKDFIESAKDGVIYFSLGSNVQSSTLSEKLGSILFKVFSSLKQKVLWKWEDKSLIGKSDNIFISDWFPQDDILAHPNVKIFITHGGLLSTTESVYHGVPIIGIPIFADQFLNIKRATNAGFGLTINLQDLDEETLKNAINEMIQNPKYRENIKKRSESLRDQPQTPLETAMFWVEYVIRHKGAPHMHSSGQELNFIQYHNLDAFLIIFGVPIITFYVLIVLIKKVLTKVFGQSKDTGKNKKD